MTINSSSVQTITDGIENILAGASEDDQNQDNVEIIADVLSAMSTIQVSNQVYIHAYHDYHI